MVSMATTPRSEDLAAEARAAVERDAKKWDEGAKWAAVELGAIDDERQAWITPTDNPYRKTEEEK